MEIVAEGFHDDQVLVPPDGKIALVDPEDVGPGDADIGDFLAHLRWTSRFGRRRDAAAAGTYHDDFRFAVLERFNWSARDFVPSEPVCLFSVCANAPATPGRTGVATSGPASR